MSTVFNEGTAYGVINSAPAGDLTILGWMQLGNQNYVGGDAYSVVADIIGPGDVPQFQVYAGGSVGIRCYAFGGDGPAFGNYTGWVSYVLTRSGSTYTWYVRSVKAVSYTLVSSGSGGSVTTIAIMFQVNGAPYVPEAASVKGWRVFSVAKTLTDCYSESQSETAIDTTNLWAAWADGINPDPANWGTDVSGNGRNLTVVGTSSKSQNDPIVFPTPEAGALFLGMCQ